MILKDYVFSLPVNIISGRHNRSTVPGTRLFSKKTTKKKSISYDPAGLALHDAHLSQYFLAFSIFR